MATETGKKDSQTLPADSQDANSSSFYVHGGRGEGEGEGEDTHTADGHTAGSQDDNTSSVDAADEKTPPAAPLTKWQKVKRHFARFKWWYLGVGIILLIILLPLLFKVIIPAIVQDIVSSQSLPVTGGAVNALNPNQIQVSLDTSLDTPLAARLDPLDMYLYNKGTVPYTPFAKIHLPELHVNHKTNVTVTNQTVDITDHTELISWFNNVFDKPQTDLSVKASPEVHLTSLTYASHLDKTIQLPALNYLAGFAITDLSFNLGSDNGGKNMKGSLNLPNSGILTLGLGNLTFNMLSGQTKLGMLTIYDVILKPGDNSQQFDGNFYFEELVPNLAAILESQSTALSKGNIAFNATGNMTVVNGERIPYLEKVLNYKTLSAEVSVITLLGDVINGFSSSASSKGKSSLLDVFGDVLGNSTLLEQALDHFDTTSDKSDKSSRKSKRDSPGGSLMWNMLRLGMKAKSR